MTTQLSPAQQRAYEGKTNALMNARENKQPRPTGDVERALSARFGDG